jgi:hypothetical protein
VAEKILALIRQILFACLCIQIFGADSAINKPSIYKKKRKHPFGWHLVASCFEEGMAVASNSIITFIKMQ